MEKFVHEGKVYVTIESYTSITTFQRKEIDKLRANVERYRGLISILNDFKFFITKKRLGNILTDFNRYLA